MKYLMREYCQTSFIVKNKKGVILEIIKNAYAGNFRYLDFTEDELEVDDSLGGKFVVNTMSVENDFSKLSNNGKFIQFDCYEKYKNRLLKEFICNDFILGRTCRIPKDKFIEKRNNVKYVEVGKLNSLTVILDNMPHDEAIDFLKDRFKGDLSCG